LYAFTKRAYGFLRAHKGRVMLSKIRERGTYGKGRFEIAGTYTPDTDRIVIDYRVPVLGVLIHEMLHAFHPNWCESKVLREESAMVNQLSRCQMLRLLRLFAAATV
jgi:hypothetical protein